MWLVIAPWPLRCGTALMMPMSVRAETVKGLVTGSSFTTLPASMGPEADFTAMLQVADLYDPRQQWASFLINALKAKELQAKNVNYIVRGKEIIIVDEFTGRTMPGRRWGDGLHQVLSCRALSVLFISVNHCRFFSHMQICSCIINVCESTDFTMHGRHSAITVEGV